MEGVWLVMVLKCVLLVPCLSVMKNRSSGSWVVNCCPSHPSDQLTLISAHYFIKGLTRAHTNTGKNATLHVQGESPKPLLENNNKEYLTKPIARLQH